MLFDKYDITLCREYGGITDTFPEFTHVIRGKFNRVGNGNANEAQY